MKVSIPTIVLYTERHYPTFAEALETHRFGKYWIKSSSPHQEDLVLDFSKHWFDTARQQLIEVISMYGQRAALAFCPEGEDRIIGLDVDSHLPTTAAHITQKYVVYIAKKPSGEICTVWLAPGGVVVSYDDKRLRIARVKKFLETFKILAVVGKIEMKEVEVEVVLT